MDSGNIWNILTLWGRGEFCSLEIGIPGGPDDMLMWWCSTILQWFLCTGIIHWEFETVDKITYSV